MTVREHQLRRRVLRLSIATAAGLALLKGGVGLWSQSLVILASALDSLLDVGVSAVNYLSLRIAEKPADEEHPYGHGKAEYLAGLFQSLLIAGSAGYLAYEAVLRVLNSQPLQVIGWGLATMAVSTAATIWLIRRLRRVIREGGSIILETEALHYTTDVWSSLGVAVTIALVWWTGQPLIDPLVAFAIAVYIFSQAAGIFSRSLQALMDRGLPGEIQERLKALIADYHADIAGYHAFRTRQSGAQIFVEFHLVFRGDPSFRRVHEITEDLIDSLKSQLPGAEVLVHMDTEEGP